MPQSVPFPLLSRHAFPLRSLPWGAQHWRAQPCFLRFYCFMPQSVPPPILNTHVAPLRSEPWGTQHGQAQPCFSRFECFMPQSVSSPFWTDTWLPCDLSHEELSTDKHSPASCVINVSCHDLYLPPFWQACVSPAICAMRSSEMAITALLFALLMYYATICTSPLLSRHAFPLRSVPWGTQHWWTWPSLGHAHGVRYVLLILVMPVKCMQSLWETWETTVLLLNPLVRHCRLVTLAVSWGLWVTHGSVFVQSHFFFDASYRTHLHT